jgi:hypothetical protein
MSAFSIKRNERLAVFQALTMLIFCGWTASAFGQPPHHFQEPPASRPAPAQPHHLPSTVAPPPTVTTPAPAQRISPTLPGAVGKPPAVQPERPGQTPFQGPPALGRGTGLEYDDMFKTPPPSAKKLAKPQDEGAS